MPLEDGFGLEILVGDRPLSEYSHDNTFDVESDLHDQQHSKVKRLTQASDDGQEEQVQFYFANINRNLIK